MSIPQRGVTDLKLLDKTCKSCSSPRLPVKKLQVSFDKEIMDENITRLQGSNPGSAKAVQEIFSDTDEYSEEFCLAQSCETSSFGLLTEIMNEQFKFPK
jgi:hypothetical protein